jgi:ABC-type amino acid transport substrate-binding protein
LSELNGKQLAIPAGWSTIPILRARFPQIDIVETESTLQALELVLSGEASAALDGEAIMRFPRPHLFLTGLQFHTESSANERALPDTLHIIVPAGSQRCVN